MIGSPLVVLTGGNGSVFMTMVTYMAIRPPNTTVSIARLSVLPHHSGELSSDSLAESSRTSIVCDGNVSYDAILVLCVVLLENGIIFFWRVRWAMLDTVAPEP